MGRSTRPLRPCHLTVLQNWVRVRLEACSLLLYIRSLVLGKANIQSSSLSLTLALELELLWPCVILG